MRSSAHGSQMVADAAGRAGPDVLAACALSAVPGLGASTMARIAARFHSLEAAVEQGPRSLLDAGEQLELKPEARQYLAQGPDLRELGLLVLKAARDAGARVLLLEDPQYPKRLRRIPNPPRLLYVRGDLAPEVRRIAVVGAREVGEAGLALAHAFGDMFARAGIEVVSGGARGIDAAAHEGALWAQGTTVAVLGCGIDVVYPSDNRRLFDRLANGGGALVSEFAPGTQPMPRNFPRRNRTVAGLSDAVVVVRAAQRSGALITAAHAAAQGIPVYAVPGDPADPRAEGPNGLLRDEKARLATGPTDVLTDLEWPVPALPPVDDAPHSELAASNPKGERPETDTEIIDATGARLWRLLDERTPAHVDDLALRAQIPAREALGKLAELELKGIVVQRPGKYFLRR
jgi:DNA processing protein